MHPSFDQDRRPPEDCGYCSQSARADTPIDAEKLMDVEAVLASAEQAKAGGSQRFSTGATWRNLKERDIPKLLQVIKCVHALGMGTPRLWAC